MAELALGLPASDLGRGPDYTHEQAFIARLGGKATIAGVDEVGRGPLAGPVVAAAVILNPDDIPHGLQDSKKLSAKKRQLLCDDINKRAISVCIAEASVAEIDDINILAAAMLAMRRAVAGLAVWPDGILVDGNRDPGCDLPTITLVKGDARAFSVAAASIVAKVFRDNLMAKLAQEYPDYGWAQNAGYGVAKHLAALKLVGVSKYHRKSFKPIRDLISQ